MAEELIFSDIEYQYQTCSDPGSGTRNPVRNTG